MSSEEEDRRTIQKAWTQVKQSIDRGEPLIIGLICAKTSCFKFFPGVFKHHQVLVFGYEIEGETIHLRVYDPKHPKERALRLSFKKDGSSLDCTDILRQLYAPEEDITKTPQLLPEKRQIYTFFPVQCTPSTETISLAESLAPSSANQDYFSARRMQIDTLKNHPEQIPILAKWLYDEWHPYDADLTEEKLIASFSSRLHNDQIPMTFVVLKNNRLVGSISLKTRPRPDFSDLPEDSLWLGSLQVIPEERNQGLGQKLVEFSLSVAKQFGYDKVYLYTSNPHNVPWYVKRGAKILEERPFHGHQITLMSIMF